MNIRKNAFFDSGQRHFFKWGKRCHSFTSKKFWGWGNWFWRNVFTTFFYLVIKSTDDKTGKGSTSVNGWQHFRWMSIWERINYLLRYLQENSGAILSVENWILAVCTCFKTLCLAWQYNSVKIVSFVFLHILSAWRLSLIDLKRSSLIHWNQENNFGPITWRYLSMCWWRSK